MIDNLIQWLDFCSQFFMAVPVDWLFQKPVLFSEPVKFIRFNFNFGPELVNALTTTIFPMCITSTIIYSYWSI